MSVRVPQGSDLSREGIPGKVKSVELGSWDVTAKKGENKGQTFHNEGLIINIEGWEYPVKLKVKTDEDTGGWDAGCAAMKFLGSLVKLGVYTAEEVKAGPILDRLVGMYFRWGNVTPYKNLPDVSITIPVAIITRQHAGEETEAPAGQAQSPEDVIVSIVQAAPSPLTPDGITTALVQAHAAGTITNAETALTFWTEPANRARLLESRLAIVSGKVAVRALAAPAQ